MGAMASSRWLKPSEKPASPLPFKRRGLRRVLEVTPALFARAGTTRAARETLEAAGGIVVDLPTLFADLAEA